MKLKSRTLRRINGFFIVFWLLMVIPTLTVWDHDVAWVGFLSVWSLVIAHLDGWLIGRQEP